MSLSHTIWVKIVIGKIIVLKNNKCEKQREKGILTMYH